MSPTAPLDAPHRLARAVVLSCAVVTAGTVAHGVAGGAMSLAPAVSCVVALIGPAWLLAGRERGWSSIAAVQLGGQELVHLLHASVATSGPAAVPHDVMFYGHVGVAALIAVWLRGGERRIWAAARRATRAVVARWDALVALVNRPAVARTPTAVPVTAQPSMPAGRVLRHSVVRRGPPLLV